MIEIAALIVQVIVIGVLGMLGIVSGLALARMINDPILETVPRIILTLVSASFIFLGVSCMVIIYNRLFE